ncbi:hypothetical protein [Onishia taeanensis]
MGTLFRAWFGLLIISFSIYIPIYFISNDSVDALEEMGFEHVARFILPINTDPSRLVDRAEMAGVNVGGEFEDVLDNNDNIDGYEIYVRDDGEAREIRAASGVDLVVADLSIVDGSRVEITFGVIDKEFLGGLAGVQAPLSLVYKKDGESVYSEGRDVVNEFLVAVYHENHEMILQAAQAARVGDIDMSGPFG